MLLLNGLLEYYVFRQKERQKGLQRPRWRLKCFYSDLRILSNGSQAILWHPAMSFAFLEDKQDKSIPRAARSAANAPQRTERNAAADSCYAGNAGRICLKSLYCSEPERLVPAKIEKPELLVPNENFSFQVH